MNIFEYVKGVKTFKKNELITKLTTLTVASNDLISNLERMVANKVDLSHEINQWVITKSIVRELDNNGYRGVGFVGATRGSCETIVSLVPGLTKRVNGYKDEVWDGKLLTLRQVNILNLMEHMEYWLKYTNMVYNVLLDLNNQSVTTPEKALDKADLKLVNGTLEFYKSVTLDLLKGSRRLLEGLDDLPDVEVNETSLAVLEATDPKAAPDYLKRGFGVHLLNPKYWISLANMNLNIARIEKMRRDNELFAMKISKAVNMKNGVNDAEIDRQIEVLQDEIIKNVNTIETIERRYE